MRFTDLNLAPLEMFDAAVFIASDKKEQEVCNLVLALALIYNDLKDIVWAIVHLQKIERDKEIITAYNGQHSGFLLHLHKLHLALINELVKLIEENIKIIQHPLFKKVEGLLSKEARNSWDSLIAISQGKDIKKNKLAKVIHRVRNKISYHTDLKEIIEGYKEFFIKNGNEGPFISRGSNMENTRFYFADAAVQGYLTELTGGEILEFSKEIKGLSLEINKALYELITKFISIKCPIWQKYSG